MKIILNGKETEIRDDSTISNLLDEMKITPQMVACELNSIIVRRKEYNHATLSDGDRVEILKMIGGG